MALVVCPECSRHVSDRATMCPGCGYPIAGSVTAATIPGVSDAAAIDSGEVRVLCPGTWYLRVRREKQRFITPCTIRYCAGEMHHFIAKPQTTDDAARISDLARVGPLAAVSIGLGTGMLFGDECCEAVGKCNSVKQLTLISNELAFTNIGMRHLLSMRSLDALELVDGCSRVNDEGIVALAAMSQLRRLELVGTSVSRACISNLRRLMPHCAISKG